MKLMMVPVIETPREGGGRGGVGEEGGEKEEMRGKWRMIGRKRKRRKRKGIAMLLTIFILMILIIIFTILHEDMQWRQQLHTLHSRTHVCHSQSWQEWGCDTSLHSVRTQFIPNLVSLSAFPQIQKSPNAYIHTLCENKQFDIVVTYLLYGMHGSGPDFYMYLHVVLSQTECPDCITHLFLELKSNDSYQS